jgi:transcriptional regulator with XRE-family HTH domain
MEIIDILERLKKVRKTREVKQETLAEVLGCSRSNYVKKESGQIPITTEEWLIIANTLNKPLPFFFTTEEHRHSLEEKYTLEKLLVILRSRIAQDSGISKLIINQIDIAFQQIRPSTFVNTVSKAIKKGIL